MIDMIVVGIEDRIVWEILIYGVSYVDVATMRREEGEGRNKEGGPPSSWRDRGGEVFD